MKIIIAGAGDIGFHLADLLSIENQDITLIDTDKEVLNFAETHLDIFSIRGDASSVEVLERAEVHKARLFIAVTTSEQTNLLASIIAKKMGAKQTIARVNKSEYIRQNGKIINFKELGIDTLISPPFLAAKEISRLIRRNQLTDVFEFENGRLSLIGLAIDEKARIADKAVMAVAENNPNCVFRPIAILRDEETIIPRGNTMLRKNDHVYFIAENKDINSIVKMTGNQRISIKRIMILGDTGLALQTASLLQNDYQVTLISKDAALCNRFAELLPNALIIKADTSNMSILKEEGLEQTDAFLALTNNPETNIITSLMAKKLGVPKTIALVDNRDYTHISQNIGIDTLINKKLIAANNIFRFVRKGKIEAVTSLNGVDAEVIEFVIQKKSKLTKCPIRDLNFPRKALIGGIIRGHKSIIPLGETTLKEKDKVIILAMPEAIPRIEEMFR
ncbi:MAG: Trk system potassium transporter TrkA [Saprospiraceae bacterium]